LVEMVNPQAEHLSALGIFFGDAPGKRTRRRDECEKHKLNGRLPGSLHLRW
jgi:hypothetical protein